MLEAAQLSFISFFKFLEVSGFNEGFKNGVDLKIAQVIANSENGKLLFGLIVEKLALENAPKELKELAKEVLRSMFLWMTERISDGEKFKIYKEHQLRITSEEENFKTIGSYGEAIKYSGKFLKNGYIMFDEKVIDFFSKQLARQFNISDDASIFLTKVFIQCASDDKFLGKPLYSVGKESGKYATEFVKEKTYKTFKYTEKTENNFDKVMNKVTCGCWSSFFKDKEKQDPNDNQLFAFNPSKKNL